MAPADHYQSNASVATNGEMFVVAWHNEAQPFTVYAMRLSQNGTPLDETPIPIAVPPKPGFHPSVAWTGRLFLIGWASFNEVHLTKLSRTGAILGDKVIGTDGVGPLVSCAAGNCVVVRSRVLFPSFSYQIVVTPIDDAGEITFGDTVIETGSQEIERLATGASDSRIIVTWQDFDSHFNAAERQQLFASVVTTDGSATAPVELASNSTFDNDLGQQEVASDGSSFFVAWPFGPQPLSRTYGRKITAEGQLAGQPNLIGSSEFVAPAGIVRAAGGYVVLSANSGGYPSAQRIDLNGNAVGAPRPIPVSTTGESILLPAGNGTNALLVWTNEHVYRSFVDLAAGSAEPPTVVSISAAAQTRPAIAANASGTFVAWSETTFDRPQIRAARVGPDGNTADPQILDSNAALYGGPAIASNGRESLVVWQHALEPDLTSRLIAERLDVSGAPIEQFGLTTTACVSYDDLPAHVASDGRDFLVTWADCAANEKRLMAVVISAAGAGAPRVVSRGSDDTVSGGIAWNGVHYLITWRDGDSVPAPCEPPPCFDYHLRALRLNRDGSAADAAPIVLRDRTIVTGTTAAAWDGTRFHVAWPEIGSILDALVSADGVPEQPRTVATTRNIFRDVDATADGSAVVLTWFDDDGDPMMARLRDANGFPPVVFRVTNSHDEEQWPAVATVRPGEVVVVYQRDAHERQYAGANRIFLRTIEFGGRQRAVRH
ncbi:MAG TPA: hypothetical protein VF980_10740 [Thermoanaerobaculia bacterium]